MAKGVKKGKKLRESTLGQVLEAVVYAALLFFVCLYFTGGGQFIYEAF